MNDRLWYLLGAQVLFEDAILSGPSSRSSPSRSLEYLLSPTPVFMFFMSGAAYNGDMATVTSASSQSGRSPPHDAGPRALPVLEQDPGNGRSSSATSTSGSQVRLAKVPLGLGGPGCDASGLGLRRPLAAMSWKQRLGDLLCRTAACSSTTSPKHGLRMPGHRGADRRRGRAPVPPDLELLLQSPAPPPSTWLPG